MNRINIKQLFKNVSAKLMQEFLETEKTLVFPLDRGAGREEAIRTFLKEKLPRRFGVSKGFVVSHTGEQSSQCDIIVYDADTSPIFYSDLNQEVFPVESVYGVIEVKSRLTPEVLDEAIKNIKAFKQVPRKDLTSVPMGIGQSGIVMSYDKPVNQKLGVLIAYSAGGSLESKDLVELTSFIVAQIKKEDILNRIDFVCIVDRGTIIPVRKNEKSLQLSLFNEAASFTMSGDPDTSVGLFFVVLLSTLNNLKLSEPDLFAYFNQ